ncbi:hypothetical protein C8J56DRAFT_782610 [Mycena floridula]|nr:hypothetical protein C8J56DRAFT_782610 [Mycena floridula]
MPELGPLLLAGSQLLDSQAVSSPFTDLKAALLSRLTRYHEQAQTKCTVNETNTLAEIQLQTAAEALHVVEQAQRILGEEEITEDASSVPLLGTRDLAQLRTLLSIAFRWGTEPELAKLLIAASNRKETEDFSMLYSLVLRLLALVFPAGLQGPIPQSLITTTLLHRNTIDVLKPCITLAWLPKKLRSPLSGSLETIPPLVMRFLSMLRPDQAILALGNILSSKPSAPHIRKICSSLLSSQLLRPHGVQGLCIAILSEDDDAALDKLEHVAKILVNVPSTMTAEIYFPTIVPRIADLLCDTATPAAHKRAAAFSLSRMLATQSPGCSAVLSALHGPLINVTGVDVSSTLTTLVELISNADPSPTLVSTLLSPIIPSLYALLFHLDRIKTSDPTLKESVSGLLATWARVITEAEGVASLWQIIDGVELAWEIDLGGSVRRVESKPQAHGLAMFTPEDLKRAEEDGNLDSDANILGLYPDPVHFVTFLATMDQREISAAIFVKLLETYRDQKIQQDTDPARTLLMLQLIMQMQVKLSDISSSSNILKKPDHILTFVKHALEASKPDSKAANVEPLSMHGLRIVPESDSQHVDSDGDSDDDTADSVPYTPDDEMVETSVNLLLSILEANVELSARTAPVLNDIFSLLEPLAYDGAPSVRALAREARIVMTARLASTSSASVGEKSEEEDVQIIYQKALKLLQDPILPVRAHGLMLLRQLVAPDSKERRPAVDAALVPAIISIFLQSVQDDDSYIYLNAIQGLAAMVDGFGKVILKGLVQDYTQGLARDTLSQQDVDTRIRVGEALGMVIRKCGNTLPLYTSLFVPQFLQVVRVSRIPTTLRTSAISLLAECVNVFVVALLPYFVELSEGMIDLLQTESVASEPAPETSMDADPTSNNSKFPPLRRAAIHFLSLMIRETTRALWESSDAASFLADATIKRAKITFDYLAVTDHDNVVRVMAREAVELLQQLERAKLGL